MMTFTKFGFTAGMIAVFLFAASAATVAISQTVGGDNLTPREIIKKSQDTYASLSSYSDEGKTVSTVGATPIAPHIFTIKLARPDLYQIHWKQDSGFFVNKGTAWCAGNGDYLEASFDKKPRRLSNMESVLSSATGISGGAAASIPGAFFKTEWGDRLGGSMASPTRKPDGRIGNVDCYVLTGGKDGLTTTLWFGKSDFLIYQIENDTTAARLSALLAAQAKAHPEIKVPVGASGDCRLIETHRNIVVNKQFAPADFEYHPAGNSQQ